MHLVRYESCLQSFTKLHNDHNEKVNGMQNMRTVARVDDPS